MCASTHIPERMYVDACVCVCDLMCQAHLNNLWNSFSCFSIVTITGQEELVSPPCMAVPPPVCMICSAPSDGLNGEGENHGPVGMGMIGCSPPVEPPAWLSVLSSSSSLVFTTLINCSWAVQSADLWSLLMSERENYIMWLSRKMWSQMSTVVTGHLMFKKPGCLCDNKKQLSSCHDADGSSHFLSPLCSPLPCMWFGLSLLRFWDW